MVLLTLYIKSNTEGVLLAIYPLEPSLLPDDDDAAADDDAADDAIKGAAPARPRPRPRRAWWEQLSALVLQLVLWVLWGCHALLLPVLGGLGTASAFESSTDASNIVLNAVAIAFVYEMDDILYSHVLTLKQRDAWEKGERSRRTSVLHRPSCIRLVAKYAWLLSLLDFAFLALCARLVLRP